MDRFYAAAQTFDGNQEHADAGRGDVLQVLAVKHQTCDLFGHFLQFLFQVRSGEHIQTAVQRECKLLLVNGFFNRKHQRFSSFPVDFLYSQTPSQ